MDYPFGEILAHTIPRIFNKWIINENTNNEARRLLKSIVKDCYKNYNDNFGLK